MEPTSAQPTESSKKNFIIMLCQYYMLAYSHYYCDNSHINLYSYHPEAQYALILAQKAAVSQYKHIDSRYWMIVSTFLS